MDGRRIPRMLYRRSALSHLHAALDQLERTAETVASEAFYLDQQAVSDDEKMLRDYYARLSLNLRESLRELQVLAAKRRHEL